MSEIHPANPYLVCDECQDWITYFDNTGARNGILTNQPCGHQAHYSDRCPSWSPVDGCQCMEHLGYVPHGEPPKKEE